MNITADPGSDDWKKTKDSNLGKNKKFNRLYKIAL